MEARLTGINEQEVQRYLGCKDGRQEEELLEKIPDVWERLLRAALPNLTYRIVEKGADEQLEVLLQGDDICNLLRESHHMVLFGATLGISVDAYLARLQISDLGQALIFDACASSAIENVCDNFCADVEQAYGSVQPRLRGFTTRGSIWSGRCVGPAAEGGDHPDRQRADGAPKVRYSHLRHR